MVVTGPTDPLPEEPDDQVRGRGDRRSVERVAPVGDPQLTDEERARIEAKNGLLQFDLMVDMVRQGIASGFRLRPSVLLDLHRVAVEGVKADAGSYRVGESVIHGSDHRPPLPQDVARLVEDLCDTVNENEGLPPVRLAAYVMWRLNWIHPFSDGNGRTSRVASYLVLCVRLRVLLPGQVTIPQQIVSNKWAYYDALDAADAAFASGAQDIAAIVGEMEKLLEGMLATQLMGVIKDATGKDPRAIYTDEEADGKAMPDGDDVRQWANRLFPNWPIDLLYVFRDSGFLRIVRSEISDGVAGRGTPPARQNYVDAIVKGFSLMVGNPDLDDVEQTRFWLR